MYIDVEHMDCPAVIDLCHRGREAAWSDFEGLRAKESSDPLYVMSRVNVVLISVDEKYSDINMLAL